MHSRQQNTFQRDSPFPKTNFTILGVFCTHAQKEYGKVLEMKSTNILNILALLFFFKFAIHLLEICLNGT